MKKIVEIVKFFLRKIFRFLQLLIRNLVSLHRKVWGKGWRRIIIAISISIILVTVILTISIEVTSRPRFCSTCHYMKPYYDSWVNSSHKHVTCTDCHFPPGFKSKIKGKFTAFSMLVNYFTGVYKKSKPWAEISDQSCMRSGCHESRLLAGKVKFKKGIIFDHEPHLKELRRKKKLRCTSCHSQIVQGDHISVTESSCFLCHFKNIQLDDNIHECSKCHDPPVTAGSSTTKPIYDHTAVIKKKISCVKCHGHMVIGDGNVPKNRCSNCHAEMDKLQQYEDTELIHKKHITDHKIECQRCHTEIQHKSVSHTDLVKPDCHACHPDYHKAQLYLFTGQGARGLPRYPSPMFESGLNCQACHIYHQFPNKFKEKGETFLANALSCEPCHGKGYNLILKTWNSQTKRKLNQLSQVLKSVKKTIKNKKNKKYDQANIKLADAVYNYNLVLYGNAIHNISFANKIMEKSYQLAVESIKVFGARVKLPYFEKTTHVVPGECSNCHAGVERTETKIFGWTFPHFKHLVEQKLSCRNCHSNEIRHGQVIINKQTCMNCHHKNRKAGCNECHLTQMSIYNSQLAFSTIDLPNVMADDVSCLDCHIDENKNLFRPEKSHCSSCHEKEYEDLFDEWEKNTLELLQKLKEKVQKERLKEGDKAYEILKILERDGSKGIHNPELYEKLIKDVLK